MPGNCHEVYAIHAMFTICGSSTWRFACELWRETHSQSLTKALQSRATCFGVLDLIRLEFEYIVEPMLSLHDFSLLPAYCA